MRWLWSSTVKISWSIRYGLINCRKHVNERSFQIDFDAKSIFLLLHSIIIRSQASAEKNTLVCHSNRWRNASQDPIDVFVDACVNCGPLCQCTRFRSIWYDSHQIPDICQWSGVVDDHQGSATVTWSQMHNTIDWSDSVRLKKIPLTSAWISANNAAGTNLGTVNYSTSLDVLACAYIIRYERNLHL